MDVHPVRGLVQPKQSCTLAVVLRATKELRLDRVTLSANIRGGKPAKVEKRAWECHRRVWYSRCVFFVSPKRNQMPESLSQNGAKRRKYVVAGRAMLDLACILVQGFSPASSSHARVLVDITIRLEGRPSLGDATCLVVGDM